MSILKMRRFSCHYLFGHHYHIDGTNFYIGNRMVSSIIMSRNMSDSDKASPDVWLRVLDSKKDRRKTVFEKTEMKMLTWSQRCDFKR